MSSCNRGLKADEYWMSVETSWVQKISKSISRTGLRCFCFALFFDILGTCSFLSLNSICGCLALMTTQQGTWLAT